jgi:hypothetical protein
VDMHRHTLDKGLGEECARYRDGADQEGKGQHLGGDDAGETEHGNLDEAGHDRDDCVGGDHGFGKPEERADLHAMQALGVTASDTWMIGDNLECVAATPRHLPIWIDVHGDGLPAGSIVKPDRIIRALTELVPPERA